MSFASRRTDFCPEEKFGRMLAPSAKSTVLLCNELLFYIINAENSVNLTLTVQQQSK